MVAIFSGNGTGFERNSATVLGGKGLLGAASLGRSGEQVFVNAANGNLLISQKDEFLVGRGPDSAIARTYNSLGDMSDENADNWRQGTDVRIFGLTGTANTFGSTVRRLSPDGTDSVYSWDGAKYVTGDGDGAHDSLAYSGGIWTWTDGTSQVKETYGAYGAIWRISQRSDTDGNSLTFTYSGANLTQVSTADGGTIAYEWSGNRITRIVTTSQGASLARTYYSYDSLGRLNGVTIDLSPNDFTVGSGATYTTNYTYVGNTKLVASISQTDGSRIDIGYDGSNRVTSLTEVVAAGTTRTTTLAYGSGYTEVTDPTGQTTRLDYALGNVATEVETWGAGNATREAATMNGAAATKFTVQANGWSAISQATWATAGETVNFGVTMQAVGTVTSQSLGLYSDFDGWGSAGISAARIVSGPGQLVQAVGGLWTVTGLSTTQATRIEVARTYSTAQWAGAYLYFDHPGGYRAGSSLLLADIALAKSAAATTAWQLDLNNWGTGGVTKTAVGTIDGATAYKYTVQTAGGWAGISAPLYALKGESYSFSLSLQASDGYTAQSFGLYGNASGWGNASGSTARIVSGPGTLSQAVGGLWTVSGLSATQATRVEIVRTFEQEEGGGAYIYADLPGNFRGGASVVAAAPYLMKRMTEPATAQLLTKITAPPAQSGGAPQVVQFAYNNKGDLVSVTDAAGNATTYTYDASGNILSETDRLGNVVTRTYGTKNELLTQTNQGPALTFAMPSGAAQTVTGNKVVAVGAGGWGSVTTQQTYTGTAAVAGRRFHPENGYSFLGLTDTPLSTSTPYNEYDYAFYFHENNIRIWENGADISVPVVGTATDDHFCQIEYDGSKVIYRINGAIVREVATSGGRTFHAGVSTIYGNRGVQDIYFAKSASAGMTPETTRFVYDSENHLRYTVNAEGAVTEYRYDRYGQQVAKLEYTQSSYSLAGLGSRDSISQAALNAWVSAQADRSSVMRTNTYYDVRGNVTSVVSYNSASRFGEGDDSPLAIAAGANTIVSHEPDGLYRITKTSGSAADWDADAHSLMKLEGDFVIRLRPGQSDKPVVGGLATSPAANASYTNPEYGFYFVANGTVYFMESGAHSYLGTNYVAGDNFWIARVGSTINYYKGPTLEAAMAAGSLRTRAGSSEPLYFDSSFHATGAVLDVGFTPLSITSNYNTSAALQSDGLYRITKTGGSTANWDSTSRSTSKAEGDFVLRLRPGQNNLHMVGGVTTSPSANASFENVNYGFYFVNSGAAYWAESGYHVGLGVTYNAGDNFWLVRVGTTIDYYKGPTLEAAVAAGSLRTRTGIGGTLYFDSSFYTTGATMDVAFTPALIHGFNTSVAPQGDGLHRVTKIGGSTANWDGDARSTAKAEGDFVLRLRPSQSNMHMVGGVSSSPGANASFENVEYGFYFINNGVAYWAEAGYHAGLGVSYNPGDNFWLVRAGTTISYYKGATLEAAMAAGALRTRTGITGTLYFDSSFYSTGAAMDVAFTPAPMLNGASPRFSRTNFIYDQAGQLLSRHENGQKTETFLYDGLGRVVGSTDLNGGATSIVFNDAATQTVVTMANGLVRTSTYNKAGDLVGHTESTDVNLLRNPLLLTGTDGWSLDNATRVAGRPGDPTAYIFKQTSSSGNASSTTAMAAVPDASQLSLSYSVKPGVAYQQFQTAIYWYDASGAFITASLFDRFPPDTANFTTYEHLVTKPANAATYYLYTISVAGGLGQWGNYSLTADNYLRNPDLAAGTAGWSLGNAERFSAGAGAPSTYMFRQLSASANASTQTGMAAVPNASTLYLSYSVKPSVAYQQFQTAIYWYNASGAFITASLFDRFPSDTANFTTYEHEIARPAGAVSYYLYTTSVGGGLGQWGAYRLGPDPKSGLATPASTEAYAYDKLGRLRLVKDSTGFNTYYVYDRVGRRVGEIDSRAGLTEYQYDANDRMVGTIRYTNQVSDANLIALADPNSTLEIAALRPSHHVWDVCSWQTFDKEGRVTSTVDGSGAVKTFDYDKAGRLIRTVGYFNRLDGSQVAAFKTSPPTTPTVPPANAAKDSVARNFYDRAGRLVAVLDGEGYLSRNLYDKAGRKVEEIAHLNATNAAHRASGTLNDLITTIQSDVNDRRTRYAYDGGGLLRFQVDGLNQVTEYGYDASGRVTLTTRYAGSIAATSDYSYGNVRTLVANSGLAEHAGTRRSWAVYDSSGRLAYEIDAENNVTGFSYDKVGQVSRSVRYAVARATTTLPSFAAMAGWSAGQDANAANRVTRDYYDAKGQLRFTVDAENYVTRHDYDLAGRLIRTVRWDAKVPVADWWTLDTVSASAVGTWTDTRYGYEYGGALTDVWNGEGNWIRYSYYANGTLASEAVVEADPSWTYYHYDGAGRRVAEYAANATPEGTLTQYAYDGHGNVVARYDAKNEVTTRTYDRLGRMLTETDRLGGITSYQYNAFGEAVKVTDARGNATYNHHDRLGRVTVSRDRENYVTETAYNVFGDAVSVTRRYNRANNAASVSVAPTYVAHAQDATTTFEYDRLGRVVKTTDAEGHYEQYTLDAFGNRSSVRNKIGGIVANAYDRRGLLISETLPIASFDVNGNSVAASVVNKFEYDARGNRTKKIEAFGLTEQRTTTYVYDKADRLIETRGDAVGVTSQANHVDVSSVVPSEKIKYDQRGRIIEKTDALGARTLFYYDKKNRKTAEIGALGTYTAYTYDKNGNILTERIYGTAVALPATAGGSPPAAPGGEYREKSYTYDKLDRVKTASVANVRSGAWNGSYYATGVGTLTTTFDYDANGNLVKTTDPAGGAAFAFFDKANRKVAEVDAENYLTFNTLDGDGNVTQEERLAVKLPGAVTTASDPTALRNSVAGNAADRITQFGYDRNGRRTSEWRLYIHSNNVGAGGALGTDGVHGGIQYHYNGLGQVWQKTFGNGDYVSYVYDTGGRLTQESRSPYADHSGASVRPTTFYYYNGVNDLVMSRQGGAIQAAGDRFTCYTYGAGGRLATMTDATGAAYNYGYDAAGNVVRESWVRQKADGSTVIDGLLYTRDLLGRVTSQAFANAPGNYWIKGDSQDSAYNAYGEVHQRGINGLWQEKFAYDGAGRLWRSNSGDGVWRYFVYDGAGRQTLVLESEGSDLANLTIDQALAAATAGGAYYVGGAYIDGINATINVFDRRGLAVQTRAPKRQLNDTTAAVDFTVGRTHNAFGEVASETDARGFTTDYTYNTMGRLTKKQSPTVNHTAENGVVSAARPTEDYYYDRAGRLIGARDANGNLTTRALLAGTGHNGSEALVTYEYHADGGYLRNDYDMFGDMRISWDEINRRTDMSYDAKGRVTQVAHANGLIDYFGYDLLGQKIRHWNNVLADNEITDYDMQGRVTRQVAFGGDTTTTSYSWNGGIATAGMGTFGGWTETTTMANGRSTTEQTDLFGRQVYKSDLGGRVYTFSYDLAGRMVQRSSGETLNYTWLNTGKVAQSFSATGVYGSQNWSRKGTTYGYDAGGNLTSERFADEGHSYTEYWDPYYGYQYSDYSWSNVSKNATATYDALNRMVTWAEAGSAVLPAASTSYEYDLVGNIRRSNAIYRSIDHKGVAATYNSVQDNWYRYDSMNRLVTKGGLSGGQIVRGYGGVDYLYDKAGQRVSTSRTTPGEAWVYNPYYYYDPYDPYGYGNQYMLVYYDAQTREDYTYDAGGVLTSVWIAQGGYTDNGDGTVTANPAPAYAALRASYTNDLMGRVIQQIDWLGDGTNAGYNRSVTYNGKGQVISETVVNKQGADTITSYTTNDFGSGSGYALGAVVYSGSSTYKNGAYQTASSTTNSYAWYDGAVQSQISYKPNTSQSTTHTTTFHYDGSGALASIYVGDGRPRSVTFVNDSNGQAIKRDESDNSWANGDPHDIWYRFGGKQIGAVGNNGTLDTDYATSIANRTRTTGTGAFRFGTSYGANHANFDLSNESITSYSQGVAAGGYTVRTGDTLETIAASLWGDSSLWYKLAEANGMAAANGLVEGQRLIVPAGTLKNRHNATTFKPFDPSETLGDINPTTPQPQKAKKGGKCGVFGIILLVVVAVAVTALTAGAAVAALSPTIGSIGAGMGALATAGTGLSAGALIGIGAASGALGSIASQGVGVLTGIQEKFSWKGVAMAAIGGAVGAGLGPGGIFGQSGAFGGVGSGVVGSALRGAASNAITQGVGVATGLQKKFDWAGVAAAGVGSAASTWVAGKLPAGMNRYVSQTLTGAASAVASSAARSLIEGTSFGDNLLAALPQVVGSTIGTMIADAVGGNHGHVHDEEPSTEPEPEPAPAPVDGPAAPNGDVRFANLTYWDGEPRPLTLALFNSDGELGVGSLALTQAATQTRQDRDGALLRAEIEREAAALTAPERRQFLERRRTEVRIREQARAAGRPMAPYDEHQAIHNYLYERGRLPGQITAAQLRAIMPGASRANAERYARPLSDAMARYGVIQWTQQAAFLAQVAVETGQLSRLVESLHYTTVGRLREVWPSRFRRMTDAQVAQYLRNPSRLGDFVYGGRMGNNRNGDGLRYRGRGFIQVTGKDEYAARGYVNNPDDVGDPVRGAYAALGWWDSAGLTSRTTRVLNRAQYDAVSRRVNGGDNEIDQRWSFYQRAVRALRPGS
jgi:YD repeat-containing protein